MRDNLLKQKIKNGESAIGTFVKMTDPSVVEVLALAGFDFFVLDTEHVAIDREQLLGILRAAEAFNITPLVRVRENQQVEILQNLDLGYMGVQVPNVDTPEQAKRMVESVKYTPLGVRGLSPSVRACGYSTCGVQEYIDHANAHTMVVSHCETKECVDNLDEILKIDGIDVIFIGPMDLSQSLGVPGRTGSELVKSTIDTIFEKVGKSDKAIGTTAGTPEAALALIERGAQYILLSTDQAMLLKWGKSAIDKIRGKE